MGAQHRGFGVFRFELLHNPRPEQARGAQLGRFHKKVHANGEKETQPSGEFVHIHAPLNRGADVFAPIG